MIDWVRLWHDMPTDPKWRVIAKRSGQTIPAVIAVFNFVLVNASANANERGRTHNLFADDIAAALDMEPEDVESIFAAMQGKVLDGEHLTGWEKRQTKREDGSAERAKAWRERNRTQANASERPDKTKIREEKKEKKACTKPARRFAYPPAFEEVWKGYPTDALMSKKEAFGVWEKLGEDDCAMLARSLPAFRAYCQANADYRPVHLCRYISQRRFDGMANVTAIKPRDTEEDIALRGAR